MGWAQDDHGNVYALGSRTGRTYDTEGNRRLDGFIVRIDAPEPEDDGHDCDN